MVLFPGNKISKPSQNPIFDQFSMDEFFPRVAAGMSWASKDVKFFWAAFDVYENLSTYPNAQANDKRWIFDVQFPGNGFEFGIILNYF